MLRTLCKWRRISFRECLRCNILQPRDCTIISRMEPKQVTISKPSQWTRLDDVNHRLYVATLAPICRGHAMCHIEENDGRELIIDWQWCCELVTSCSFVAVHCSFHSRLAWAKGYWTSWFFCLFCMFCLKALDKTWEALETLLAGRRRTIIDMLTTAGGVGYGQDVDEPAGSRTDVYKLLSDLYMQTCSVKAHTDSVDSHTSCHMSGCHRLADNIGLLAHDNNTNNKKKRSERRKHCALAVVTRSQKFSLPHRPPSRDAGPSKF